MLKFLFQMFFNFIPQSCYFLVQLFVFGQNSPLVGFFFQKKDHPVIWLRSCFVENLCNTLIGTFSLNFQLVMINPKKHSNDNIRNDILEIWFQINCKFFVILSPCAFILSRYPIDMFLCGFHDIRYFLLDEVKIHDRSKYFSLLLPVFMLIE